MQFNQYDLAQTTLGKQGSSMAESYIPLWVYSSGSASTTSTSGMFLVKGSTIPSASTFVLDTISSNWPSTQKFAFEASIWTSNASYTAYARIYDITSANSYPAISTTSTTATLLRTSSFIVSVGHTYGVQIFTSNSAGTVYISKAHLVPILS